MVKVACWLTLREILARKSSFVLGVAMVVATTALCTGMELIARARETAVAGQIDQMGPALYVIPAGKNSSDRVRFEMAGSYLSAETERAVRRSVRSSSRLVEGRMLAKVPVDGLEVPAIGFVREGVSAHAGLLGRLRQGEAVLGASLSEKLGKGRGDSVWLNDETFRVAGVLPEGGQMEDAALLAEFRDVASALGVPGGINELGIYPEAGVDTSEMELKLRSRFPQINVINATEGRSGEWEIGESLRSHRLVLYLIAASVTVVCLLVWSSLNAMERQLEIATLVALGGGSTTVLLTVATRTAAAGLLGSIWGYCVGAVAASTWIPAPQWKNLLCSPHPLFEVLGFVLIVSLLGALPSSVYFALRGHVQNLNR